MKPLNQKEINEKFFNFMILFIICVAVFSFALYYDFSISSGELKGLREKNLNYEKTFNRYADRYAVAKDMHDKLNSIREKGRPFGPGEMDDKARTLNKMYSEVEDDSTNDVLQIFKVTKEAMINEMVMIKSLTETSAKITGLTDDLTKCKTDLTTCNTALDKANLTINNQK